MDVLKKSLIILPLIVLLFSCSKEEEEVKLIEVTASSTNFDSGYLMIKLVGGPGVVDSIKYTNTTKGSTIKINTGGLIYTVSNDLSILSKPLLNGNTGDNVQCCVYLNTASEIGIVFDTAFSTIQTPLIPAGTFCETGTY